MPAASLPNIESTGARGYLQWLQADQPGLYERVLPQLREAVPQLWSDQIQTATLATLAEIYRTPFARNPEGALGQYYDSSSSSDASETDTDISTSFTTPSIDTDELASSATLPSDEDLTADTANTTAVDPTDASTISSIVSTTLDESADDALAQATQDLSDSQLDNAVAGNAPLAAGTSGIGQVFSTLTSGSTGTALLIGGALFVLALVLAG